MIAAAAVTDGAATDVSLRRTTRLHNGYVPEDTFMSSWFWHSLLHADVVKALAERATPALQRSGLMRPATHQESKEKGLDGPLEE